MGQLILSRHRDESILIGDDIIITIVDIRGDKVRVGIDCPRSIRVDRSEVRERIVSEAARAQAERVRLANGNHRDGGIEP